jgi:hypothetical protein
MALVSPMSLTRPKLNAGGEYQMENERMTIEEIRTAYDGEWVLLGDPQTNNMLEILGGKILSHSKDRTALQNEALKIRPRHSAVLYIGDLSESMIVIF